jgi:AraC family transcriptional regulator
MAFADTRSAASRKPTVKRKKERFVPLLIEVEQELHQDIDLKSLATRLGVSSFHFHRTFLGSIGETPKKHVERLRLERASYLLAVTDEPIIDIALAVGFKNPETLSRNFKKFLGFTPRGYRRMAKAAQAERVAHTDFHSSSDYRLSRARFEKLPPTNLLAVRRMGEYGTFHNGFGDSRNPWSDVLDWAVARGISTGPLRLGIYYDDPTLTPKPLQRADFCIAIDRPIEGADTVRCIRFAGGLYGVVEYVGRIEHLLNAFRGLADEIRRSGVYSFAEGPPMDSLLETNVDGSAGVHRIEVAFPVKRIKRAQQESSRTSSERSGTVTRSEVRTHEEPLLARDRRPSGTRVRVARQLRARAALGAQSHRK